MRAFIAIELPKDFKDYLANIQAEFKATGADVKWVEPNNIHLTLKFLGEIDDKKMAEVARVLETVACAEKSFSIRLKSIGAFPNTNSPRVIWVGLDKGDNETGMIAGMLEEKISEIGIPKENRSFSTHITIGRLRSGLNRLKLVRMLNSLEDNPSKEDLEFKVSKITLFKSTLAPYGPIYEILKEASLKAT